jgi:putative IMPACT (imprinted ancient) family translation regulator
MMEVLRHQDLDGVLATVVRYFGGVKLGAGGLLRAYTDAVAQALLGADKVPLQRLQSLRCCVPYALEGFMRREIHSAGFELIDVSHGSVVTLHFSAPDTRVADFTCRVNDAGLGQILWLTTPS